MTNTTAPAGAAVDLTLRRIVTDLHGDTLYTWAVTVYLLTATISGPIYGKLSDLFGRRPITSRPSCHGDRPRGCHVGRAPRRETRVAGRRGSR
jgi:hypothetical protein